MNCCQPTIVSFANEATKTIPYTASMQELYGPTPNVQVYIKDGEEFVLSDDMSGVVFDGTNIIADFGGQQNGIVKIF